MEIKELLKKQDIYALLELRECSELEKKLERQRVERLQRSQQLPQKL